MPLDTLITWMMVFLRSVGVVIQLPVIAGRPIPVPVRVGLCVCLANLVFGVVPSSHVSHENWGLLVAAAGEVVVGLALGFVVRLAFAAVEMAGRLITSEIGMTASPGMGVPEPSSEPVASLLSTFAIVLFFLFGAHHGVLTAFARSFLHAAPGHALLDPLAGTALIRGTADLIELGLRMAAPFIALNFLVTLAFSVLSRAVPNTNVYIISMPIRALLGLSLLGTAGTLIAHYLYVEWGATPLHMLQLLPAR